MYPCEGAQEHEQDQADDEHPVELHVCDGNDGHQGDPSQGPDVLVALDPLCRRWARGVICLDEVFPYGVSFEPGVPEVPQGVCVLVEERPISRSIRGQTLILSFPYFCGKYREHIGGKRAKYLLV